MSNRIVISGAGTGKTHKLVQTCIDALKDPRAGIGIDEILIVTFTKAAAAELRERIAKALNEAFAADPASTHLARQIALLDRAQISTIHSFCLELVSRHFSELGLSPRLATLEPAQASILEAATLDQLFEDCYAGKLPLAARVTDAILGWFRGDDLEVRRIVQKLYHFTQAFPSPQDWIATERDICEAEEPDHWRSLFAQVTAEWAQRWTPLVAAQTDEGNPARAVVIRLLKDILAEDTRDEALRSLAALENAGSEVWPKGSKKKFRDPVKRLYLETAQLASWSRSPERDPLADDWRWSRGVIGTLLDLLTEFAARFANEKRRLGLVDFSDLEQFSLQLLWEKNGCVSAQAAEWRDRFKLIFVDEYQDTNPAQDKIIEAIAQPPPNGNRFLVGDVKQSIYSFRNADPSLFEKYEKQWAVAPDGEREYLVKNWRSHERLLDFVNGLFTGIMSSEVGGVNYDAKAQLVFARDPKRESLTAAADHGPRVEVHYIPRAETSDESEDHDDDSAAGPVADLAEFIRAEAEAEVLAERCREIIETNPLVLPGGARAGYGDIMILMRAPKTEVEAFAKVFSRHGISFEARRAGYFNSIEVLDLINLLAILDNPLQDIPLLGVLRSPIGCFSIEDLAALGAREETSIFAALRSLMRKKSSPELRQKAARFLDRFDRWRKFSQSASLAARLEEILEDTAYEDWVLAQPRGEQRRANIRRFIELARQFDAMRGEGLFPFLQYLKDHMEEGDLTPPSAENRNAVRLSTIHNSKGLQYPIVALAGLAKNFNEQDFRGSHLIDFEAGLALRVRPRGLRRQYPSVPFWLAAHRQKKRMRDEEMRLLYVALTRAQFHLLLVARPAKATQPRLWAEGKPAPTDAKSALDWIAPWLTSQDPNWLQAETGANSLFTWRHHTHTVQLCNTIATLQTPDPADLAGQLATLRERLEWQYPHREASLQEAKTSATALRRLRADEPELAQSFPFARSTTSKGAGGLKANQAGSALHRFLERANLASFSDPVSITAELARLAIAGILTADERAAIDAAAVTNFWTSPFGREILEHTPVVHRELAFTARFSARDLEEVGVPSGPHLAEDEFIVVQGAADLVVLLEKELWLVDFKTDRLAEEQLPARVAEYTPQLRIYALALSRIYKRPVTRGCLHFLASGHIDWVINKKSPKTSQKPPALSVQLNLGLSPDISR